MAKPRVDSGGGLAALAYVLKLSGQAGGLLRLYGRLAARNACKTCALGMGGQRGGMVNEAGHFPEVCKKSIQAQTADMAGTVSERFFDDMDTSLLLGLTPRECEALGRLAFPVVLPERGRTFRRISWDEAISIAGTALREAPPEEVFFYASGRSSNEAAYLFQLMARAYGSPHVHNCSSYCHAASSIALKKVYGSGTSSVILDDLARADLALVIGANPASNHPRLITQLVNLRRRGGKVIVVNPIRELGLERFRIPSDWRSMLFGSVINDLYLQPHAGTDVALLKALLKRVAELGAVDRVWVDEHTTGWNDVALDLASTPWDLLLETCGVEKSQIDRAAAMLAEAKRGVLLWAMGLTHHVNGVDNVLAVANLALARGWLGAPGCGLLPIRGHSNVQGVGSVGVHPNVPAAFAAKLAELYGVDLGGKRGLDTHASLAAAHEGRIRAAVLLGGNLFGSSPDSRWAAEALQRIGTSVYMTTKLNPGHFHGRGKTTLLLPVLARDEEAQPTTQESMFNLVRLSDGGKPAVPGEMRSEVEIIAALAERILPPGKFDWSALRSHRRLREEIAKTVPGFRALARIDDEKREFLIEGRAAHRPVFRTEDGRAHFHVTPLPDFQPGPGEYRLMTLRSEGQFNTVVYEEEDLYRGNTRRDVVMMSSGDARKSGLAEGTRVVVSSDTGAMEASVALIDLPEGNAAMYFPEANVLVPGRLDPLSHTPAFKSVAVRIAPVPAKR